VIWFARSTEPGSTGLMGICIAPFVVAMKVRLTKKHAECIDGVDLTGRHVGDVMDLEPRDARLLVAERWAMPERRKRSSPTEDRRRAEDRPRRDSDAR
jgi:hypothetical protein